MLKRSIRDFDIDPVPRKTSKISVLLNHVGVDKESSHQSGYLGDDRTLPRLYISAQSRQRCPSPLLFFTPERLSIARCNREGSCWLGDATVSLVDNYRFRHKSATMTCFRFLDACGKDKRSFCSVSNVHKFYNEAKWFWGIKQETVHKILFSKFGYIEEKLGQSTSALALLINTGTNLTSPLSFGLPICPRSACQQDHSVPVRVPARFDN